MDLVIIGWLGAMESTGGFWTKENCSTKEERDEGINIVDGEEGGVELSRKERCSEEEGYWCMGLVTNFNEVSVAWVGGKGKVWMGKSVSDGW